jgi:hypothetical protein
VEAHDCPHQSPGRKEDFYSKPDVEVRDALCDIQVFDMGAQHLMGYDGDRTTWRDVVSGVMTPGLSRTTPTRSPARHSCCQSVTKVYFEGEVPRDGDEECC